nr:hypothetical protein CFP56_40762 [Quercus suber]
MMLSAMNDSKKSKDVVLKFRACKFEEMMLVASGMVKLCTNGNFEGNLVTYEVGGLSCDNLGRYLSGFSVGIVFSMILYIIMDRKGGIRANAECSVLWDIFSITFTNSLMAAQSTSAATCGIRLWNGGTRRSSRNSLLLLIISLANPTKSSFPSLSGRFARELLKKE